MEARRAADRKMFGDLVGCALSGGEPTWSAAPDPRWRVPYRSFDGKLVTIVEVNPYAKTVLLTEEEREALLEQVERCRTLL